MNLSVLGQAPTIEELAAMVGPAPSNSPTPAWERALVSLGQSLGGHINSTPFMQVADSGDWAGAGKTAADILMRDVLGRDPETGEQGLPGVGLAGTFAGRKAATANLHALTMAKQLAQKGENAADIWKHTGWWVPTDGGPRPPGGAPRFEIPDDQARFYPQLADKMELGPGVSMESALEQTPVELAHSVAGQSAGWVSDVLDHQNLYKAYPDQTANVTYDAKPLGGGLRGMFSARTDPWDDAVTGGRLAVNNALPVPEGRSTVMHEMQHLLQDVEGGFSTGGTRESARSRLDANKRWDLSKFKKPQREVDEIYAERRPYRLAKELQDWEKHVDAPRTPYQLMKSTTWYQHSDKIRSALGVAPKRAGAERDQWTSAAAQMLRDETEREFRAKYGDDVVELARDLAREQSGPQLRNKMRTYDRRVDKAFPMELLREKAGLTRKFDDLGTLSNYELYRRLGGEAEARATQARLNMSPDQRAATPPWMSYDVSLEDLLD